MCKNNDIHVKYLEDLFIGGWHDIIVEIGWLTHDITPQINDFSCNFVAYNVK